MKLLSVIIPVYNAAPYVEACINSIYQQRLDGNDFEIILINDGSTDDSLLIITELQKRHDNIHIFSQKNQGPSVARNKGIKEACGKYISFVDADDLLIPGALSYLINYAERYSTDVIEGKYIEMDTQCVDKGIHTEISLPNLSETHLQVKNGEQALIENFSPAEIHVVVYLYRRKYLIENQIYFIPNEYFEDVPYCINTVLKTKRFLSLPVTFYIYRRHSNSITSSITVAKLYSMNNIIHHIHLQQKDSLLSESIKRQIRGSIFRSLSLSIWYLSHQKSLYIHRKEIIRDLKKKVPELTLNKSLKERVISVVFHANLLPAYISLKYILARKKYR
jgi:glycosyltransferase involved in cell wall biosynthesis